MIEFLAYICLGLTVGYAYFHPEKVKEVLKDLIDLIDKGSKPKS